MLKFKIHIAGHNALLTADQLHEVLALLADCEHIAEEYVGAGKGDNGGAYRYTLRKTDIARVQPSPVLPETVDAMRLVTKLFDEERANG